MFCEKPLALTVELCDDIIAARNRAGRVLQVGYMKRFDPAVERLYDELPASAADVRLISVEVNDPDHEPFVGHLPMTFGRDVAPALIAESRALGSAQLAASAGRPLDVVGERGLGGGFLSAMVHDVAVVHGLLAGSACRCRRRPTTARCSTRAAASSSGSRCRAAVASR